MIHGIGGTSANRLGGLSSTVHKGAVARTDTAGSGSTPALTTSAAIVADGPPIETDRVAALRAAIRAGSYKADPVTIASRMMEADL